MSMMIDALAGVGKTTTVCMGLGNKRPPNIVLTQEQMAVIKEMRSYKWKTAAAIAFNKHSAKDLQRRVPGGVQAETINAFGHRAWCAYRGWECKPDGLKSYKIFKEISDAEGMSFEERQEYEADVVMLVKLCKNYVNNPDYEFLDTLCDKYDIKKSERLYLYTQEVWKKGLSNLDWIDYDDQNAFPILFGIKLPQFDTIVLDECQDLTVAKQIMAFRMLADDGNLVAIGDRHQAIYGFSGADSEAMDNLWKEIANQDSSAVRLEMNITQRCPKAVVREANRFVPKFKASKSAPEGYAARTSEIEVVERLQMDEDGYMVLSRTNAALTSLAFRLIAGHRRCYVQGRNIGQGLRRDITRTKESNLSKAVGMATEEIEGKIAAIRSQPFPNKNKIEMLGDRIRCIQLIAEKSNSIESYCRNIDQLFKDSGDKNDIQLSTVHKVKGLEHPRVVIYKPKMLPMVLLRKPGRKIPTFQVEQENNLAYVAYTRSQHTLLFAEERARDYEDMD